MPSELPTIVHLGPYRLFVQSLPPSPLAGYTNLPMRLTVRELGGLGWATTDLVNARSLLENNPTALKLVATSPEDRPLAVQLFGSVAEEMRDAAVRCQELGVQSVDINMGCPVKKVTKIGGGSAMMTDFGKTVRLVRGMIEAVKIPVTAKMRLGWDEENLDGARSGPGTGRRGRGRHLCARPNPRPGFFRGRSISRACGRSWTAVRTVPVIANGDVTTPEAAKHMFETTGCAGVSIGRGAFYDPWIFRRTAEYLRTGELAPEPDFTERVKVMRRHFERYCEFYGEANGAKYFRKVAPWYARRFGPAKPFKQRILTITCRADFEAVVAEYLAWRAQFCGEDGELREHYRPAPMVASFMREGSAEALDRNEIPVPKGPVENW